MPNNSTRFSSEYLPHETARAALLALPGVFQVLLGDHGIIASYGWSAKIHPDLYYKPMREDTRWLQYLIEDSIEHRIIIPGESDFRFEVPDKRLDVLFCHESDIHLDGVDDELLHGFMQSDPFLRMRWYNRAEVQLMMP